ncbi:MAG: cytochrome P450 [Nevskiales bacterium]
MNTVPTPLARNAVPPGPKGWPVLGVLPAFQRDQLGFVRRVASYGDVTLVHIAGLPFYMLSHPEHIREVFENRKDFRKGNIGPERRLLLGKGLATAEGDFWLKQRHISQPAFHRERIMAYGRIMSDICQKRIAEWPVGEVVDLHAMLMRMALESVAKVLFNANVETDAAQVGRSMEWVMRFFGTNANFIYRLLPRWFQTPGRVRFRREVAELDRIIQAFINERRKSGDDPGDLLSMMMGVRYEDGSAMSDQQIRDEVMTLFLAGHETTALALSFSFALLAQHPEAEARLLEEIQTALGDRPPTVEDIPRLPYTEKVLKESMRVYPPAWILARQTVREVEIGGYKIPPKAFVSMSEWVTHHDPRWFPEPERFMPERWTEEFEKNLPKHAYFPFGAGPRGCIGRPLAMMEATLFLTTILQRYKFTLASGYQIVPDPSLSLRPKGGVRGSLQRRSPSKQGVAA